MLVAAAVSAATGVNVLSCKVKPSIVIKSPPIILKIASLIALAGDCTAAVNVGFAPEPDLINVIDVVEVPVAVIEYPPTGAVSV